jgi:hypothetical protein
MPRNEPSKSDWGPPKAVAGLVISYRYLWAAEAAAGREEGVKPRPCLIVSVAETPAGLRVTLAPISSQTPNPNQPTVRLPEETKRRFRLEDKPSFIYLSEVNRFIWPGPDLDRIPALDGSYHYGHAPHGVTKIVQQRFVALIREADRNRRPRLVERTA